MLPRADIKLSLSPSSSTPYMLVYMLTQLCVAFAINWERLPSLSMTVTDWDVDLYWCTNWYTESWWIRISISHRESIIVQEVEYLVRKVNQPRGGLASSISGVSLLLWRLPTWVSFSDWKNTPREHYGHADSNLKSQKLSFWWMIFTFTVNPTAVPKSWAP